MDDLLQSLASSGQGSSTRSRTASGGDAQDGDAFGMEFDAATADDRPVPDDTVDPDVLPTPNLNHAAKLKHDTSDDVDPTAPFSLQPTDALHPVALPVPQADRAPMQPIVDPEQPLVASQAGHWMQGNQPHVLPTTQATHLPDGAAVLPQTQPLGPHGQPPRQPGELDQRMLPNLEGEASDPPILPTPKAPNNGTQALGPDITGVHTVPNLRRPSTSAEIEASSLPITPTETVATYSGTPSRSGFFPLAQDSLHQPTPTSLATGSFPAEMAFDTGHVGSVDLQTMMGAQAVSDLPAFAPSTTLPTLAQTVVMQSPGAQFSPTPRNVLTNAASVPPLSPNSDFNGAQTSPPISASMTTLIESEGSKLDGHPDLEIQIRTRSLDTSAVRTGSWMPPLQEAMLNTPPTSLSFTSQPVTMPGSEMMPQVPDGLDIGLTTTQIAQTTLVAHPVTPIPHAPTAHAHAMAQQIANALGDPGRDPGGIMELALDPPELGRLRMQMTEVAGIMTLTIQAERPETAELMRRHLDLLAREFADAGLAAPNVNISQDGADQREPDTRENDQDGNTHQTLIDDTPHHSPPPQRTGSGALDLRL